MPAYLNYVLTELGKKVLNRTPSKWEYECLIIQGEVDAFSTTEVHYEIITKHPKVYNLIRNKKRPRTLLFMLNIRSWYLCKLQV